MKEHVWRVVAFLFALSASVSLFVHLYRLMSVSQLPSGLGAALYYDVLANGRGADSPTSIERLLHPFVFFTMHAFNLGLFTALKLVPTFLLSILPILIYFLSLTVTRNRLVGVASAWITAFTPAVIAPLMIGNYSLVLGLFLFTAYLSISVRCLKSNSRVAPYVTLLASVLVFPLLFLSALSPLFGIQDQVLRINFGVWAENLWLSLSIAAGVSIGVYALIKRVKMIVLPVLLASAIVPLALAFIPTFNSLHVLSIPVLALFVASPLLWLRESCLVHEVNALGHSPVVEVVIDLPKLAAVLLVAFLTISTMFMGYSASASIYKEYSVSRHFTDGEIASALKWMDENIHEEAVLSSKPIVAAWLGALSGKRFIGFRGFDEALVSETIESTSFRILTPSLLVDEWEPFSVSKAPCISYYDGGGYEPIAYIDDSFVRVRLIKDSKEWIESPYRSAYRGYRWLSITEPEVILVQYFETHGLFFEKKIRVSTSEPRVKVEYRVHPKVEVELVDLELPVRVEPWKKASILGTTDDETTLIIDGRKTKISYFEDVVGLMREEYDEEHVMIKAEITPKGDALEAGVLISVESKERSERPLWFAHTPELIKSYNIKYVVAETGKMAFIDRSLNDPVESMIIKDSFNRILFHALDNQWVETPSSAGVRFDETSTDGVRVIGYETNYLHINKTLTKSERSIEVRYAVAPIKNPSSLVNMNLTLWIPWSVLLLDHEVQGDMVKLKLGSGEFEVRFIGDLVRVEVGPDPEYGQNRVQAVLGLRSEGDEVGVNVSSLKPLLPVMESDLSICADVNLFRVVFKQGALMVCQTNP